jgi:hypothetical protein
VIAGPRNNEIAFETDDLDHIYDAIQVPSTEAPTFETTCSELHTGLEVLCSPRTVYFGGET